MTKYFKACVTTSLLSLSLVGLNANAMNSSYVVTGPGSPSIYLGVFGGAGGTVNSSVFQYGTVISSPLGVNASGTLSSNVSGFGGANFGYAWKNACRYLTPAIELEGYYISTDLKGNLVNPAPASLITDHFFHNTFTSNATVFLFNTVVSFNLPNIQQLHPYIGAGIGGALVSMKGNSAQINPPEPLNHFNSKNTSNDSTFAGQAKVGLNWAFNQNWSVFADYRFLYLGAIHQNFGSTLPTPVPHNVTSAWGVNLDNLRYNLGSAGIQFSV